jgi:hypothetical protein
VITALDELNRSNPLEPQKFKKRSGRRNVKKNETKKKTENRIKTTYCCRHGEPEGRGHPENPIRTSITALRKYRTGWSRTSGARHDDS